VKQEALPLQGQREEVTNSLPKRVETQDGI